jgi:hypothetical protein
MVLSVKDLRDAAARLEKDALRFENTMRKMGLPHSTKEQLLKQKFLISIINKESLPDGQVTSDGWKFEK